MNTETFRKLGSIQRIIEVRSIPEADKICAYKINGWYIVDQVGKYSVGDLVVYVETDAWIPTTLAPFLSKGKEPKEYLGIKGERLRTIRLKKQLSQGLILPLSTCIEKEGCWSSFVEGTDVSEWLGIVKWEPPPEFSHADARGLFPSWGHKTDQERVQNIPLEYQEYYDNEIRFEITEKVDGSSFSSGKFGDDFVVCSRNLSLKLDDNNTYVKVANKHNLESKLDINILVSGELLGPGVQGNSYGLLDHDFWVFDIYNPDTGVYISAEERYTLCKKYNLNHVPVLYKSVTLKELGLDSLEKVLAFADGGSVMGTTNTKREGLVFKSVCGKYSFKAISNNWLLSEKYP